MADRFVIVALAGDGGMGTVYRALDDHGGAPVAIKVLKDGGARAAERFGREAAVLAGLDHGGIVRHVAHGVGPDGRPWLAMEWLEGESLSARLARERLGLEESIAVVRSAARAVAEAHRAGIVHRDLKPSNLLLVDGRPDDVKVLDFGLAKVSLESVALTAPSQVLGTPAYMAPEQITGQTVDARADVWSLGCVLYECLAGRRPFVGELPVAILAKAVMEDPEPIEDLVPAVPEALATLVARMLEKDPGKRPADAGALYLALDGITSGVTRVMKQLRTTTPPSSITAAEQEVLSVVLAPACGADETTSVSGVLASDFGAEVHVLLDRSVLGVVRGRGVVTDLATRAARAALAVRHALAADRPVVLATGRALAATRMPVGEVVDRAASLARSGGGARGVLLDELTAGLLPAAFEVDAGSGSLVLVAERPEAEPTRLLLGTPTPCVGRDKELRVLGAVLSSSFEEPSAQVALLIGPAGAGKTRLCHELLRVTRESRTDLLVFVGRSDPLGSGAPFGLVSRALAHAAGLRTGEPAAARRSRLRARIARHVGADRLDRVTDFLGEIVAASVPGEESVPLRSARADPQLMGDQVREAFVDLLAAECAVAPVILYLEDLQWGDLPSLRLVEEALDRLAERPLLVLATARPEVEERFPTLWKQRGVERLHLGPLPRRAGELLAARVLGDAARPERIARIVERAAGNAFFLEELLRAEAEGRGDELPATVVAAAQARLHGLGAEARRILRAASIAGFTFHRDCLTAMLGSDRRQDALGDELRELCRQELIATRPESAAAADGEYVFRHEVVREAAYRMLTDDDRALGHRIAARFLEERGGAEALVIAQHLERGGAGADAALHWLRAAEQACEGSDLDTALALTARGVACGAAGELLGRLLLVESDARGWRAEHELALDAARRAAVLLPPGTADWWDAAGQVAVQLRALGRRAESAAAARELLAAEPESAVSLPAVRALVRAAGTLLAGGEDALAGELGDAAHHLAARIAPPDPAAGAWIALLACYLAQRSGDVAAYLTEASRARALFEAAGDVRRLLGQAASMSFARIEVGRFAEAEAELRAVISAADRHMAPAVAVWGRQLLGLALYRLGRLGEAREVAERVLADLRTAGNRSLAGSAQVYLAMILRALGDLAAAELEAVAAAATLREVAPPLLPVALATLAAIRLDRADVAGARAAAEDAVRALERAGHAEEGESLVRLLWAEALRASGDPAARGAIEDAHRRLLERAAKISDPELRASFLDRVAENARTIELHRAWIG